MTWISSSGRDISHHNPIGNYDAARAAVDWVQIKITESSAYIDPMAAQHHRGFAGKPRGAYHFARPGSFSAQIRNFLTRRAAIGAWERPDMLDCEFDGVTAVFIRDLVAEYRRQSGRRLVLVYVGYADLRGACNPAGWCDPDTPIWAARYRKIGPPAGPDTWGSHLGWDHPGLAIYQYDNAAPLPGGGLTDINAQRVALGSNPQEEDMDATERAWLEEAVLRLRSIHTGQWAPPTGNEAGAAAGGDLSWMQVQLNTALAPVLARLDKLEARPAADVDEDALAAALAAHGLADAISVLEMKQLLTGLRFSLGPPTEGSIT